MKRNNASFRDPSGYVYQDGDRIFRQVNKKYRENYDLLMSSGLYARLTKERLLVAHTEVDSKEMSAECYKTICPEKVGFVSYPYEWSFSQYRDAATATLRIQQIAVSLGMCLKDASAYNIQFHKGLPVLIDTLSFDKYLPGSPWVGYRQFCKHFLAPIALMSNTDIRLSRLMSIYIDGIPLDLASALLPWPTYLNFSLLSHIHIHSKTEKKYANAQTNRYGKHGMSELALNALLDNLLSAVSSMQSPNMVTEWGNYYHNTNYTLNAFDQKKKLISQFLDEIRPRVVWDFGGNTGEFSRVASQKGVQTISFDIDPVAVEKNYSEAKLLKENNLLPLLLDLTNPSPGIGWGNLERESIAQRANADCVMALALIHHLVISNNLPLEYVADYFSKLSPYLIVEFVPKEDSKVQVLLASREDIFDKYTRDEFEVAFEKYYSIIACKAIEGSGRVLYLMRRKS